MSNSSPQLRIVEDFWRQLSAVDQVLYRRARKSIRRRRRLRTLAIAVLLLLALAAVALAARDILFGTPAPRTFLLSTPSRPTLPFSPKLLSVRVNDPQGGPPWGLQVFTPLTTTEACVEVGRVVQGQLVALGIDHAFNNDGRAHPLPVEADGCGGTDANGHSQLILAPDVRDASGVLFPKHCLDPRTQVDDISNLEYVLRRIEEIERTGRGKSQLAELRRHLPETRNRVFHPPPPCDPAALRTIFAGFVGPAGGTVTLTESTGRRHVFTARRADDGAFLFVLSGQLDGKPMLLTVRYPNGMTCVVPNPWWGPDEHRAHPETVRDRRACLRAAGFVHNRPRSGRPKPR